MATNMPRVAVAPMKTPSQTKAVTPVKGMAKAQKKYSLEAAMTSGSSVRRLRKPFPPSA